jgi:hypothetical protein
LARNEPLQLVHSASRVGSSDAEGESVGAERIEGHRAGERCVHGDVALAPRRGEKGGDVNRSHDGVVGRSVDDDGRSLDRGLSFKNIMHDHGVGEAREGGQSCDAVGQTRQIEWVIARVIV